MIVIGLDGLEPRIVQTMLAAGELPNLQRLRAEGAFSRVATTTPAQTPVAWSTFATGTNPGGHGIFD
ncbi:MAG: alkaline phosphatase family protein, partial [Isosphaeraceae bacterium]